MTKDHYDNIFNVSHYGFHKGIFLKTMVFISIIYRVPLLLLPPPAAAPAALDAPSVVGDRRAKFFIRGPLTPLIYNNVQFKFSGKIKYTCT